MDTSETHTFSWLQRFYLHLIQWNTSKKYLTLLMFKQLLKKLSISIIIILLLIVIKRYLMNYRLEQCVISANNPIL